jgi:hypothetical protein
MNNPDSLLEVTGVEIIRHIEVQLLYFSFPTLARVLSPPHSYINFWTSLINAVFTSPLGAASSGLDQVSSLPHCSIYPAAYSVIYRSRVRANPLFELYYLLGGSGCIFTRLYFVFFHQMSSYQSHKI